RHTIFSRDWSSDVCSSDLFYQEKKKEMLWSDDFDLFARAIADYSYYAKKEFYPIAYKRRSQEKEFPQLSKEFYNYRKNIDFNNRSEERRVGKEYRARMWRY